MDIAQLAFLYFCLFIKLPLYETCLKIAFNILACYSMLALAYVKMI